MPQIGYHDGTNAQNNVTMFVERNAEAFPHRTVFHWLPPERLEAWSYNLKDPLPHESLDMATFATLVRHTAAGLRELGLRRGDRAIVFVPMSIPLYVAMSGLQRIGAIPVFLDSWARRAQLGASANAVAPKALISFEQAFQLRSQVPQLENIQIKISVGPVSQRHTAALEQLMRSPNEVPVQPVEKEETALVTFTTGSSGTPKGANRTHRFSAAQHYALNRHLPYVDTDADLPVFPIFSLNNIAGGIPTVIPAIDVGVPQEMDSRILQAQIRACNVTCTTLSPSHLNGLSASCLQQGLSMPGLRRVVTGGAPISRDNLVDFRSVAPAAEIWAFYGSTEVEPIARIEVQEMLDSASRASIDPEWVEEGVNVGHIDSGLRYRFLKISKEPISELTREQTWRELEVSSGQVGELVVAGEHVCRDYYNNQEAFVRSKIVDFDGTIWHRSGDLGRLDDQGHLWIVGRIHNLITRQGELVFPVRAEIILRRLPFVQQGALLGMPDTKYGERTLCVVVPTTGAPSQHDAWEQEIRRIFRKHGIPLDGVVFRPSIPMDPRHHSKVEYDVLRNELLELRP
jgi:acyl-CoA synthetase (AMP-forming)/AMP-acid ligase II